MELFLLVEAPWRPYSAALLILLGFVLVWRGLDGGPNGDRSLLRRRVDIFGRLQGFRYVVIGLALIGLGGAWIWQAQSLLILAIGIGGVEILESSVVIAVMRRDGCRTPMSRV